MITAGAAPIYYWNLYNSNRVANPEKNLNTVLSRALLAMKHCPEPQLLDSWMDQVSMGVIRQVLILQVGS